MDATWQCSNLERPAQDQPPFQNLQAGGGSGNEVGWNDHEHEVLSSWTLGDFPFSFLAEWEMSDPSRLACGSVCGCCQLTMLL